MSDVVGVTESQKGVEVSQVKASGVAGSQLLITRCM